MIGKPFLLLFVVIIGMFLVPASAWAAGGDMPSLVHDIGISLLVARGALIHFAVRTRLHDVGDPMAVGDPTGVGDPMTPTRSGSGRVPGPQDLGAVSRRPRR